MSDAATIVDATQEMPSHQVAVDPLTTRTWTGHPPADELVRRIVEQVDATVARRTSEWSAHLEDLRAAMRDDLDRMRHDHDRLLGHLDLVVAEVTQRLDGLVEVAEAAASEHRLRLASHVEQALADLEAGAVTATADAGWYRDDGEGCDPLRWWDGDRWGEATRYLTVAPHLGHLHPVDQA